MGLLRCQSPVHAWAAWKVYKHEKSTTGKGDLFFLESVFHKLLLNFTWWVNRKDSQGSNLFEGGFLCWPWCAVLA